MKEKVKADKNQAFGTIEQWIEKFENVMLILAFIAIALYMADLLGVWTSFGLQHVYKIVAFIIDLVFAINLIVKMVVIKNYLNTPWFPIDLISSLPILASIELVPGSFEALRFVRTLRMFRALRALRMLNTIPLLKFNVNDVFNTREVVKFKWAIWIILFIFTTLFSLFVNWLYSHYLHEAPLFEFYLILGILAGIAIAIIITRYQIPALFSLQTNKLLNVALPVQVANHFILYPEAYSKTVKMPATVMFCDIKGFTSAVEQIGQDLSNLKHNLELVMVAVTDIHIKYDLIIDKFIGDAIMSFRGGDIVQGTPEEHAWRVVKAALESYKAVLELKNPYFRDIKIGGASASTALIGAFGTPSRLSYTILGDKVNLAARLESVVKYSGTTNLFCDITYQLLKNKRDFVWRRYGKILVEGKNMPTEVFEVFDADDIPDKEWLDQYHLALEDFEQKKFHLAKEGFVRAAQLRPGGDIVSERYASYCQTIIDFPDKDYMTFFTYLK